MFVEGLAHLGFNIFSEQNTHRNNYIERSMSY